MISKIRQTFSTALKISKAIALASPESSNTQEIRLEIIVKISAVDPRLRNP